MRPTTLVLDSHALITYLEGEGGASHVLRCLERAHRNATRLLLSLVNWGEVYYALARAKGAARAEECVLLIDQLPIELVGIDRHVAYQAAQFKAQCSVAFGDCVAAALAKREACPVLTGDPEFQKLHRDIAIEWLDSTPTPHTPSS